MPANIQPASPKTRTAGLLLLVFGGGLFALLGFRYEPLVAPWNLADLKEIYYSTRCAMHGCDPYQPSQLYNYWQVDSGNLAEGSNGALRRVVDLLTNLPTTLLFTAPLAILPWHLAERLWMVLMTAGFMWGAYLMWKVGASFAPRIAGALVSLVLLANVSFLISGGWTPLVMGFVAVGVYCFVCARFETIGALCLAAALTIKPHDAGFIWLFFLLAGGTYRKRALQTAAFAAVIGALALLWIHHASPHWYPELQSNLREAMAHGGRDDPGPAGGSSEMIVSMQAALSLFRDDPRFYNPASYLISGVFLLGWAIVTWRARPLPRSAWFALAAVVPFSMLPVYHRAGDTAMLLLAVPACAILWYEKLAERWWALLMNTAVLLLMAGFLQHLVLRIVFRFQPGEGMQRTMMLLHPLSLLALGIFYLWVYFRQAFPQGHALDRSSTAPERNLAKT